MAKLHFEGKQHIYAHHMTVPVRALVPVAAKSVALPGAASAGGGAPPPDGNLIIHGDNLLALKSLLPRYEGRVNCIYIDPPYNTGNEGWVYNDRVNSPLMRGWLAENSPVDGEDLLRHDKWLCMMWPRLHLLHALLAGDGVIFVSIDDNEVAHLRMLMDEIFGEENFFASLIWESRTKPTNMGSARFNIQSNTETVLVYGKNTMTLHPGFRLYASRQKDYPLQDEAGQYRLEEFQQRRNLGSIRRDTMVYPIDGILPKPGYRWQVSQSRYESLQREQRVLIQGERVFEKVYEGSEDSSAYSPFWSFIDKEIGTSESGKDDINRILGIGHGLETVKPYGLIAKLIYHSTRPDALVLDSFAGSGTTAEAVLALNKEDGGNRRFILVECEGYADTITAERVRRVIRGAPQARTRLRDGLGGEFTYCRLGGPIDVEAMLTAGPLPSYSSLAAWLLFIATGRSAGEGSLEARNDDGLFHSTEETDYYLLYEPDIEWLEGEDGMLRLSRAQRIQDACLAGREAGQARRKAVVFGVGRYIKQDDLTPMGITFCQIPYETRRGA